MAQASLRRRNRKIAVSKNSVESKLEMELEKAKMVTGLGYDLKVVWAPNTASDKHGEVKAGVILIYDQDEENALQTLKHEFIHHHLNKGIVEPLIKHINLQKCLIEDLIYRRVEELVDRLSNLL